jgi:hypothetical protein
MASIDKTYTDSYKDYKEFKDWADTQIVTFFDGHKECIGDWVRLLEQEDFTEGEVAIMNTPGWVDTYLIQHCKSRFVIKRMKEVYSKENFEEMKAIDLTSIPEGWAKNRKIVIQTVKGHTKFPLHSAPYGGDIWWVQCDGDLWYNDETGVWANHYKYPTYTNVAHAKSIKALVRHLRKQYLPKDITFSLSGNYIGEVYEIKIK